MTGNKSLKFHKRNYFTIILAYSTHLNYLSLGQGRNVLNQASIKMNIDDLSKGILIILKENDTGE